MLQCKISVSPPRGNFDFKFACLGWGGDLFFSAVGPMPHMLALSPPHPLPIKFSSAGFDFLPACVTKCSCATLIEHICKFKCTNKWTYRRKKIIALSNSIFSQDIVIVYEKTDESPIEWQPMTTSNNKWQWVAANDSGTANENVQLWGRAAIKVSGLRPVASYV